MLNHIHQLCPRPIGISCLLAALVFSLANPSPGSAATGVPAIGAVEGRVFNPATGEYLENARITVEGTALEALTDSLGQYIFPSVPVGLVKVRAFYTGLAVETASVNIAGGQTAQQDFNLTSFAHSPESGNSIVKLS